MMAHNVKIVTANGSVTLRGPVKTEEEKPLSRARPSRSPARTRSTINSKLKVSSKEP